MAGEGDGGTDSCPRKLTEQMETAHLGVHCTILLDLLYVENVHNKILEEKEE